jgi:hypothetical protein
MEGDPLSSYPSNPAAWVGLGFVATIENAPADVLETLRPIAAVAAQIVWGLSEQKPELMSSYLKSLDEQSLEPVGWGWCNATSEHDAAVEGRLHAELTIDYGLGYYIANMEEPYDAHGDQGSPRYHMPDAYLDAFRELAPLVELAVTTTPRWASNHAALRDAGAVLMPQAFPLENGHTVEQVVSFAHEWGWTAEHVRPLVQTYRTNGVRPDAATYNREAEAAGVGVVPYTLEQALDDDGRAMIAELEPSILRQPAPASTPEVPTMELIGTQHGVTAAVNRLRGLDPSGTKPNRNPDDLSTWGAWDKLERTLSILVADHDTQASSRLERGRRATTA